MKKLRAFLLPVIFAGTAQLTFAQASVNKIIITQEIEHSSPDFIDGISFTPDGILQNTESSGSKSIKTNAAPIASAAKVHEAPAMMETSSLIERLSGIQFKYAMMLDVDVECLKNISLLGFIDDWFGTHYRLGGSTKEGVDCSALTGSLLMAVYGFAVPRTAREQYKATKHIKKKQLKEGDLVFFNTHGGVSHVGLYIDNHYFVHASSSEGVTISNLDDTYYKKRFICGGRIEKN
ncbi:MAG: C40 family peptidase [Bacteroidota bacterium]|nr:C40 family peptidase [Bacteroidota bacterium]